MGVRIAVSGTPSVGKTTITSLIIEKGRGLEGGYDSVSVKQLAEKRGLIGAVDPDDDARPIDVDALSLMLAEEWSEQGGVDLLVDGHLSHLLPVDAIVIIRCHPNTLERRLRERGYSSEKIAENLEWELMGGVWNDIGEDGETPVLEVDSSTDSTSITTARIVSWLRDGFKPERPERSIDWIEMVHGG